MTERKPNDWASIFAIAAEQASLLGFGCNKRHQRSYRCCAGNGSGIARQNERYKICA